MSKLFFFDSLDESINDDCGEIGKWVLAFLDIESSDVFDAVENGVGFHVVLPIDRVVYELAGKCQIVGHRHEDLT